jgi:Flp pilus assembly pilin Flp
LIFEQIGAPSDRAFDTEQFALVIWNTNLGKEKKLMINTILHALWNEEEGQDMVEYALLLAFVALAAVSLLSTVKGSISTIWQSVSTNLTAASS